MKLENLLNLVEETTSLGIRDSVLANKTLFGLDANVHRPYANSIPFFNTLTLGLTLE